MELKFLVMQMFEDSSHMEELFGFNNPETAMEVCQQLRDKSDWHTYEVVVRYA